MKFVIEFFNRVTNQSEHHTIETHTVGRALQIAIALTSGKDPFNTRIVQED